MSGITSQCRAIYLLILSLNIRAIKRINFILDKIESFSAIGPSPEGAVGKLEGLMDDFIITNGVQVVAISHNVVTHTKEGKEQFVATAMLVYKDDIT
ncbi:hypothetical protein [Microscilla marina]|nr:hypothetical protein [Microscilla marina]